MKTVLGIIVLLTGINCILFWKAVSRPVPVRAESIPEAIRARSLEIVDSQGRTRAEIKLLPAPASGQEHPADRASETVQFRLFNEDGGPRVKIGVNGETSGMYLGGQSGYVQLLAQDGGPVVSVKDQKGRARSMKP